MSYKESLDAVARPRSDKKLELVGLRTCPYELDAAAWIDDVTLWPPVEFPDIVLYLLQTPGQYTHKKLEVYTSLEAYNYFVSGKVCTYYHHEIKKEFCMLKAYINHYTTGSPRFVSAEHTVSSLSISRYLSVTLCFHYSNRKTRL